MDQGLLQEILSMNTIAVVGCSPNEMRPSNNVAHYLKKAGYKIIPVNPGHQTILGEKCYPNLLEIPEKIEIVNIFRKSEHVFPIVQDAIKIKAKAIWMQDGVIDPVAKETAEKAGLKVIMNDCIMREHYNFEGPKK